MGLFTGMSPGRNSSSNMSTWLYLALGLGLIAYALIVSAVPLTRKGKQRKVLIEATGRDNLHEMSRLLKDGLNPNFAMFELSPIGFAFRRNSRPMVDLLLSHGASLSPGSRGNANLIIEAARSCNPDLIDLALAAGHRLDFRRDGSG